MGWRMIWSETGAQFSGSCGDRRLIMRTFLTLAVLFAASPALAQTTTLTPKTITTVPIRPAAQTPVDTFKALGAQDRIAIQSDLAWTGVYNGNINGEFNEGVINAIKSFQQRSNAKQTGALNPQERAALAAASKKLQDNAGWRMVDDMVSGGRLGVPLKLTPQVQSIAGMTGMKWSSAQGQIQIETWRVREPNLTTAIVAGRERAKAPPAREVKYNVVRPDFFVMSGMQGLKKFYIRGALQGGEVRGMTILYDQATEGTMGPVVIAMSSAFNPFRAGEVIAPPRRLVDYATGVVVSADGAIVTDRAATDGCQVITVAGRGNADRIASDEKSGLTLLRIYGDDKLAALSPNAGAAKADVTLTGIADPQAQGGRAAVTSVAAKIGADATLMPAPNSGFAGAPAFDADGRFAGLATLKPVQVAGAGVAATQGALISADAVRAFLDANGIKPAAGAGDAKAAVVRVICVRK
jgi:hypothetical protein